MILVKILNHEAYSRVLCTLVHKIVSSPFLVVIFNFCVKHKNAFVLGCVVFAVQKLSLSERDNIIIDSLTLNEEV